MDDESVNEEIIEKGSDDGVKINLISSRKLDSMASEDKLRFILDEVKNGTVLVLERGLTATEEINLIKATMSEIDQETFIGIEMQSYSSDDLIQESWINRILGRTKVPKMSVIGPANLLRTIHKDGNMIQAMILTQKSIISEIPTETPLDEEPETETFEEFLGSDTEVSDENIGAETNEEIIPEDEDIEMSDRGLPIKGPKSEAELGEPGEDENEVVDEESVGEKSAEEESAEEESVAEESTGNKEIDEDSDPSMSEEDSTISHEEAEEELIKHLESYPPMAQPIDIEPSEISNFPEAEPIETPIEGESRDSEKKPKQIESEEESKESEPVSFLYKRLKTEEE